jgi:ABC-2 type transport system permease protein
MKKISLIIQREFLTRIRKKSFLITTLLVPLAFAAMIIVPILLSIGDNDKKRIAVIDQSGLFENKFHDENGIYFKYVSGQSYDSLKENYEALGYQGVLYIPQFDLDRPGGFQFYSKGQASITLERDVNKNINEVIEAKRLEKQGIDQARMKEIRSEAEVAFTNGKEEKKGNSVVAYGVGYASGFIIYIVLLLFGTSVMRGVMEEKVNRIAEVMVSSVKPFQLMMGKIVGIAAVGLLQFLIWGILITVINMLLPLFVSADSLHAASSGSAISQAQTAEMVQKVSHVMNSINWSLLIPCFFFYFLGGYLFYSSLYAAVGSLANEDAQDIQQLTIPITVPIIIGIMIMMKAVQEPESPLAVWGSIIPFTSPMVMMGRLPYGVPGTVPYWQLGLSFICLIGGFIITTWAAGRIYRTGILLYGKKVTLKEALKWVIKRN